MYLLHLVHPLVRPQLFKLFKFVMPCFRSFTQLIGDLNELREKDYGDEARGAQRYSSTQFTSTLQLLKYTVLYIIIACESTNKRIPPFSHSTQSFSLLRNQ